MPLSKEFLSVIEAIKTSFTYPSIWSEFENDHYQIFDGFVWSWTFHEATTGLPGKVKLTVASFPQPHEWYPLFQYSVSVGANCNLNAIEPWLWYTYILRVGKGVVDHKAMGSVSEDFVDTYTIRFDMLKAYKYLCNRLVQSGGYVNDDDI